jgi:hypothetical protein
MPTVRKEQLVMLISHPSPNVRLDAIRALQRFYSGHSGITEHILDSIKILGLGESGNITSALRCFLPTSEDIRRMAFFYTEASCDSEPFCKNLINHIEWAISRIPFPLLEENKTVFLFNSGLKKAYESARQNNAVIRKGPDHLWTKLLEFCKSKKGVGFWGNDLRYGKFLIEGLKVYPEIIRPRIILNLKTENKLNYHFEEYLIELSGEMKIKETTDDLFKRLKQSVKSESLQSMCVRSLGLMGGSQISDMVKNLYFSDSDPDLKILLIEILSWMPDQYGEKTLLKLIKEENDPAFMIFLARAVYAIFSLKGTETVKQKMLTLKMDRVVQDLETGMMTVYICHQG